MVVNFNYGGDVYMKKYFISMACMLTALVSGVSCFILHNFAVNYVSLT